MPSVAVLLDNFLRRDLLTMMCIGLGCVMLAACLERRKLFVLRVVLGFVLCALWLTATRAVEIAMDIPWWSIGMVRYIGLFVLFGFAVAFWSKASFCQALYAITVSYSLQNLCEKLSQIPRYSISEFPMLLDRFILLALMSLGLWIYFRACIYDKNNRKVFDFSNLSSIVMLFLSVAVIAVSIVLEFILQRGSSNSLMTQNSLRIMSALFSLLTIVVSMSHLRETESEKRAKVAAQLLYAEQNRYEQEKQLHDVINVKCHDIRHQIAALGDKAYKEELNKIGKLVDIYDATPRTQCIALDVALSSKVLACNSLGIMLTCLADGRCLSFMADGDIYALFGNILDNAIDAVSRLEDQELRAISLTVSNRDGFVLIEEENYFSGALVFSEGLPVTTKKEADYHGFGTRSIQMLTSKYGGNLNMRVDEGIFHLSIMLPIPTAD